MDSYKVFAIYALEEPCYPRFKIEWRHIGEADSYEAAEEVLFDYSAGHYLENGLFCLVIRRPARDSRENNDAEWFYGKDGMRRTQKVHWPRKIVEVIDDDEVFLGYVVELSKWCNNNEDEFYSILSDKNKGVWKFPWHLSSHNFCRVLDTSLKMDDDMRENLRALGEKVLSRYGVEK